MDDKQQRHHRAPAASAAGAAMAAAAEDDSPSRHLWVGNVAMETPESVVRDKFGRFGDLESVTVYPQRQYAFVNFRKQEDAERAKDGLFGAQIAGQPLRIEFAKGARPSRHLGVGGIAANVSRDMLEAEFVKHGHVEEFKFMRDKNAAFVDYFRTDDAISALAALNGKRFGDEELKIDYRSTAPKRAAAPAAPPSVSPRGSGKDESPSEVLWIGLPVNVKFDEESIQKLFMSYGEIVRIKLFASRSYCFVQFRTAREAAAAKNALSGKVFNGHRLHIEFSTSGIGPVDVKDDHPPLADTNAKKVKVSSFLPVPLPENGAWNWQGFIAKTGTAFCQVRGFAATGRVETLIPEVLNCTSRTDLDVLENHVYPASEFTVILFKPVRDVDVSPYQDFVQYLKDKRRAGVAKLGDGTTLFLVPPSAFSETVLKVARADSLIGFVMKFQPQLQQQPLPHHFQTPPGAFNVNAELIASIFQQQQPPPQPGSSNAYLPPAWSEQQQQQQQANFSASAPPPTLPPGFGDSQFSQAPSVPQLPMDQLAQLTALLKHSQQQQQQPPVQQNWMPPPMVPPQQQIPVTAAVAAALPQFQGDPERIQRTLALAAQLLNSRNS